MAIMTSSVKERIDRFTSVLGSRRGVHHDSLVTFMPFFVVEVLASSDGGRVLAARMDWSASLQGELIGGKLRHDPNSLDAQDAAHFADEKLKPAVAAALAEKSPAS